MGIKDYKQKLSSFLFKKMCEETVCIVKLADTDKISQTTKCKLI